ncbi:MAG: hypothetical protein JWP08_4265 [Bryobacterales bacterium]|nr:hypothetical protein [Bryobacterales bacterium]
MAVVAEVALGVCILVGAGLLLRTFAHLVSLPPGFDGSHVLSASLSLQDARYAEGEKTERLFRETLARILKTPGIESAGIGLSLPYARALNDGFTRPDSPQPDDPKITNVTYVTPGYFEALRMNLLRGRRFDWRDTSAGPQVAVVNEAFARRYLSDKPPLGLHLKTVAALREIVGIVGDVQQGSGWGDFGPIGAAPTIYVPAAQVPAGYLQMVHTWFSPSWVIRSSGSRQSIIATLQSAIADVDPHLPFSSFKSMDEVRAESVAFQRVTATLLSMLAELALLLAGLGIYGLVASTVVERTRELGIRMAVGATVLQAMKAVVLPGMALAGVGLFAGCIASLGTTRYLRSLLWGVRPTDALTLAVVCGLLMTVAILASVVPGLRVAKIDPAISLRGN